MRLNDSENQLATSGVTEEELKEWLVESETTGYHRGYGRSTIAMALIAKIDANQRIAEMNKALAESIEEIDLAELERSTNRNGRMRLRDFIVENRFGITEYQQRLLLADIKSLTERERADRKYFSQKVGYRVKELQDSLKRIEGRENYQATYAKRLN